MGNSLLCLYCMAAPSGRGSAGRTVQGLVASVFVDALVQFSSGRVLVGKQGFSVGRKSLRCHTSVHLIVEAFQVLRKRNLNWGMLPHLNVAFTLMFLYWAASIAWSPYPFITFKRLFKEFGNVLIVLVVLTETNPSAAFRTLGVRAAMILFPWPADARVAWQEMSVERVRNLTRWTVAERCAVHHDDLKRNAPAMGKQGRQAFLDIVLMQILMRG